MGCADDCGIHPFTHTFTHSQVAAAPQGSLGEIQGVSGFCPKMDSDGTRFLSPNRTG